MPNIGGPGNLKNNGGPIDPTVRKAYLGMPEGEGEEKKRLKEALSSRYGTLINSAKLKGERI